MADPLSPAVPTESPASAVPDYVPVGWTPAEPERDLALDLIRGLAMMILVFNHTAVVSAVEYAGASVLSAAEVLVAVSGVIVGIVFGDRWRRLGGRAVGQMLWRRARKLYLASVAVVALVGTLTLVPGLATEALAISPTMEPARDMYAYDGLPRLLLAIVTLEAGPWQFNILGFFIAALVAAPAVLWALHRGWWLPVIAVSLGLFVLGRELHLDVLPSQSERPFPLLIWQVLFVGGIVAGWHRKRLSAALGDRRRLSAGLVAAAAGACALGLLAGVLLSSPEAWHRWQSMHFDKGTLDLARIAAMMTMTAGLYVVFRRYRATLGRALGPLLLPLGQNSFYVFIVHVFLCLAIASVPLLGGEGLGLIGNSIVELAGLALLWAMVRQRFLFRWIPR
jgi:hypothetical protein